MPPRNRGPHRKAVEAAITASGHRLNSTHGPLLELCRTLSSQMDAAGEEPSTRLSAAYLSALKDLTRAQAASSETPASGKVAKLRALHGAAG